MCASFVGFSGSRRLTPSLRSTVRALVREVSSEPNVPVVGCAAGLDLYVRASPGFRGRVFRANSRSPRHLVKRSVALVEAVAGSGPGRALIVFPGAPCPAPLRPHPLSSHCFCGLGSGSWASAAFAAGLGVPVFVFGVPASEVPDSWGSWSSSTRFSGGFKLAPFAGLFNLS